MIDFLKSHQLVTLPDYLGKFEIRQLPEAFKPTSPGGFMNPPGVYDKDPAGFFFIPTYNPESKNFYIRAAIEDPRPILDTEEFPVTLCNSQSRIIYLTRSGGNIRTAFLSKAGPSTAKRC